MEGFGIRGGVEEQRPPPPQQRSLPHGVGSQLLEVSALSGV